MIGPVRTPHGAAIAPMVNRSGFTIRKNCLVGYGTPSTTGERAIDSLDVAGVAKTAGVIQHSVENGIAESVFLEGADVVVESDGSGAIAVGDKLMAVAGATLAASGRVATVGAVAGTNYEVVGEALTAAAAVAGTELVMRMHRYTLQGA